MLAISVTSALFLWHMSDSSDFVRGAETQPGERLMEVSTLDLLNVMTCNVMKCHECMFMCMFIRKLRKYNTAKHNRKADLLDII